MESWGGVGGGGRGNTSMAQDAYIMRTPGLILGFRDLNRSRTSGIHVSLWSLKLPMYV